MRCLAQGMESQTVVCQMVGGGRRVALVVCRRTRRRGIVRRAPLSRAGAANTSLPARRTTASPRPCASRYSEGRICGYAPTISCATPNVRVTPHLSLRAAGAVSLASPPSDLPPVASHLEVSRKSECRANFEKRATAAGRKDERRTKTDSPNQPTTYQLPTNQPKTNHPQPQTPTYRLTNHQPIVRQYDSVTSHTSGYKDDSPASASISIRFQVERL